MSKKLNQEAAFEAAYLLVYGIAGDDVVERVGAERAAEIIRLAFVSEDPEEALDNYVDSLIEDDHQLAAEIFAQIALEILGSRQRPEQGPEPRV